MTRRTRFIKRRRRRHRSSSSTSIITQIPLILVPLHHLSNDQTVRPFEFIERYELTRQHALLNNRLFVLLENRSDDAEESSSSYA